MALLLTFALLIAYLKTRNHSLMLSIDASEYLKLSLDYFIGLVLNSFKFTTSHRWLMREGGGGKERSLSCRIEPGL